MKKLILPVSIVCLLVAVFLTNATTQASATSSKTTTKKVVVGTTTKALVKTPSKTVAKAPAKPVVKVVAVKWAASGLKSVARIPSGVRPAYKKKVENYARRNNIKLITAAVVNGMRE